MCFSVKVPKNIQQLSLFFDANISEVDFESIEKLFKIQAEMDRDRFDNLMGKKNSNRPLGPFKLPGNDDRIMPGYFANVIVAEKDRRVIKPMRFQVRPSGSDREIDGIYNARFDSLDTKKTWQPLFMRKHGLVPFTNFYEWVEVEEVVKKDLGLFEFLDEEQKSSLAFPVQTKKKLITFYPENRDVMWAPCLWDEWTSKNGEISFKSFAIITDEPPKEVETMGHDRCPIFLKSDYIEEWLNPQTTNKTEIFEILQHKEDVKFLNKWA